jgi:hypothetical protein
VSLDVVHQEYHPLLSGQLRETAFESRQLAIGFGAGRALGGGRPLLGRYD